MAPAFAPPFVMVLYQTERSVSSLDPIKDLIQVQRRSYSSELRRSTGSSTKEQAADKRTAPARPIGEDMGEAETEKQPKAEEDLTLPFT